MSNHRWRRPFSHWASRQHPDPLVGSAVKLEPSLTAPISITFHHARAKNESKRVRNKASNKKRSGDEPELGPLGLYFYWSLCARGKQLQHCCCHGGGFSALMSDAQPFPQSPALFQTQRRAREGGGRGGRKEGRSRHDLAV